MTLADAVGVMSMPDRIRIMEDETEIYAGYLGNFVYSQEYKDNQERKVVQIKEKMDITHKRYKELGLMQPIHPEQTKDYKFSDLQMTLYRTIILKKEG